MSHQDVGPRLLGAIALITLFAACSPRFSTAAGTDAERGGTAAAQGRFIQTATAVPSAEAVAAAQRGLPDFADLVAAVGPAVVNVQVVEKSPAADTSDDEDDSDDPFGDFFRRFGIPRPLPLPRNQAPVRGIGSGFIISADGYILTNAHVVNNASKITVKLTDRREFDAKVIGVDERTDVAVIKINAKGNLPVVKMGDSSRLRPGQWVLAIGSPFGFENSVTAGVVSATARSNVGVGGGNSGYVPFIQTDVAVNPGNSGGPLFNLYGEVIGINSQIYSNSGGYEGISFAIPIDVADNVAEQLIKTGHVSRGRIGVTIQEVTAATAQNLGLDRPRGAAVASVEPGGPADKAGVEPLDIILSVNGEAVETSDQLPSMIAEIKPGQVAHLQIWRDKSARNIEVTVEQLKEKNEQIGRGGGGGEQSSAADRFGLTVRSLSAADKAQLRTRGSVVVAGATGPAAEAGLREGDVILSVNRSRVGSVGDFDSAIKAAGKDVTLLIQRDNQQIIVTISLQ